MRRSAVLIIPAMVAFAALFNIYAAIYTAVVGGDSLLILLNLGLAAMNFILAIDAWERHRPRRFQNGEWR